MHRHYSFSCGHRLGGSNQHITLYSRPRDLERNNNLASGSKVDGCPPTHKRVSLWADDGTSELDVRVLAPTPATCSVRHLKVHLRSTICCSLCRGGANEPVPCMCVRRAERTRSVRCWKSSCRWKSTCSDSTIHTDMQTLCEVACYINGVSVRVRTRTRDTEVQRILPVPCSCRASRVVHVCWCAVVLTPSLINLRHI